MIFFFFQMFIGLDNLILQNYYFLELGDSLQFNWMNGCQSHTQQNIICLMIVVLLILTMSQWCYAIFLF